MRVLGPEVTAVVRAVHLGVLVLTLVGAGFTLVTLYHLGVPPAEGDALRAGGHGPRVTGSVSMSVDAAALRLRLPAALAVTNPWCEILARDADGLVCLNRRLLGRTLLDPGGPYYTTAAIRVRARPEGGAEVHYDLDYSRFAAVMWRLGLITLLFVTLPNLIARAPLDWYLRWWVPEWQGRASLGYSVHALWPLLAYGLYRMDLRAGRSAMLAAVARAAELAAHAH